jgi:5-formyltetrahydrofolate cyclo-ligase
MTEAGVARFPGAQGRIPNFECAETAADRLAASDLWKESRVLKCNPDSPQRPVRERALREGKVVYMAVPRLRDEKPFLELDPSRLQHGDLRRASTIKGAFQLGRLVHIEQMQPIDLIVAGSVVVNKRGGRVGKGGGYSDLEYALTRSYELVGEDTPIVTTVHPLQILEDELPRREHDIPLDVVATPEEIIYTGHTIPRPEGIYWDLLPEDKLQAIPVLQQLRAEGE